MKCETEGFVPNQKQSWKEKTRKQQVGGKGIVGIFPEMFSLLKRAHHFHLVAELGFTEAVLQGNKVSFVAIVKNALLMPSNLIFQDKFGQMSNGKPYGQKLGQDTADLELSEMTKHDELILWIRNF